MNPTQSPHRFRTCRRPQAIALRPFGRSLTPALLFALALLLTLGPAPCGAQAAAAIEAPAAESLETQPTLTFPRFAPGKPIRMVAYGDMRFTDPSVTAGTNPRVRKWLAQRVAAEHPEALLLTGDMPYTGAKTADWQVFQDETADWRVGRILQLPATGNHETNGGKQQGIANYLSNFPQIAGHLYYSALLGSVEVTSLDCTGSTGASSPQARWFAAQLDHLPSQVEFLLILYHIPWMVDQQSEMLANLPSKDALAFRDLLEARLDRLRARVVVFNGHVHSYERFERRGVEYIVTGGGGAEPYPVLLRGSADLYRDTGFPVYHYLTLEVRAHQLHAIMWKVKDPEAATLTVEKKDEFTLTPTLTPAPSAPARKPASSSPGKAAAVPQLR